jgi:hypothetical protein
MERRDAESNILPMGSPVFLGISTPDRVQRVSSGLG